MIIGWPPSSAIAVSKEILVRVDGWPVTLVAESLKPRQFSAVLLIDTTASLHLCPNGVAGIPSSARKSAGSQFPDPIPPVIEPFLLYGLKSGDRIRVGVIGRRLMLDDGFSTNGDEIRRRWRKLFDLPPVEWLGPSPIWDAVAEGVAALAGESGQRAVVLFSDGAATGNVRGRREVAALAARAGVTVNVVAEESVIRLLATETESDTADPAVGLMALAHETGGVSIFDRAVNVQPPVPCSWRNPELAMQSVLDRLHQAYALSFVAPADGRTHDLDVRVNKPGSWVAAPKIIPEPRR
jgi:hypothetical protein